MFIGDVSVELTGSQFGLSGQDQIALVIRWIDSRGEPGEFPDLYAAVEDAMDGHELSFQGRSSVRFFVNEVAVERGFIRPYDPQRPGWYPTEAGYQWARAYTFDTPRRRTRRAATTRPDALAARRDQQELPTDHEAQDLLVGIRSALEGLVSVSVAAASEGTGQMQLETSLRGMLESVSSLSSVIRSRTAQLDVSWSPELGDWKVKLAVNCD